MEMERLITNIIEDLINLPEIITSHPMDVAFCLGSVVTKLEIVRDGLENYGNGDV